MRNERKSWEKSRRKRRKKVKQSPSPRLLVKHKWPLHLRSSHLDDYLTVIIFFLILLLFLLILVAIASDLVSFFFLPVLTCISFYQRSETCDDDDKKSSHVKGEKRKSHSQNTEKIFHTVWNRKMIRWRNKKKLGVSQKDEADDDGEKIKSNQLNLLELKLLFTMFSLMTFAVNATVDDIISVILLPFKSIPKYLLISYFFSIYPSHSHSHSQSSFCLVFATFTLVKHFYPK